MFDPTIVRGRFDGEIQGYARYLALKDSVAEHGILNPIIVDKNHKPTIGQRRVLAAQELGFVVVPVLAEEPLSSSKWQSLATKQEIEALFSGEKPPRIRLLKGALRPPT